MDPTLRTLRRMFLSQAEASAPGLIKKFAALALAFACAATIQKGFADAIEPALLRGWFTVRGARSVPQSVSLVRLDKIAYDKIGLAPGELFPRQHMAEGLRKIAAAGAKLIIIDGVAQRPAADSEADRELAAALASTPTVIVHGREIVVERDLSGTQRKTTVQHRSLDDFEQNAKGVVQGMVRLTDGVVREICLSNERDVFSAERVPLLSPLRQFVSPGLQEPGGFDFINYYGGPGALPSVSFATLIGTDTPVPADYFRDRVVLIGSMSGSGSGAEAGKDSFLTSVSNEWMFGVEIHATIAANLLDQSWIRRFPLVTETLLQALVVFAMTLLLLNLGVLPGVLVGIAFMVAWLGASFYLFAQQFYFLPAVILCIAILIAMVLRWGGGAIAARRASARSLRPSS